MNNNLLTEVSLRLGKLKHLQKKIIFSISATAKQEENAYLTPIRDCNDFVLIGCVVFSQEVLPALLKVIDGVADVILVDSEKKMPLRVYSNSKNQSNLHHTVGYVEAGSISKICFQLIKKSKVFEFKPNDLTVDATWSFVSHRLKFLSGKKISILGAGNIGSKLALKLVECGAEVSLYRRDFYKGRYISHGLNLIKPEGVISNIQFYQNAIQASFLSDVLIGASNGIPVIDNDVINSVKKKCLIVDLGKNNLTDEALKIARLNSMEVYRTDVTSAIETYTYGVLRMQDIMENSYGKKELDFCNIVGGGYYGELGDIVVDKINKPQRIIGVCQGNGSLKSRLNNKDKNTIRKLKDKMNIED